MQDSSWNDGRTPPVAPGAATSAEGAASGGAELRAAPRFTMLVRTAKLIADGREYLCVLRDASATGVKVRLFHPLPAAERLELGLGNGDCHPMQLMWASDDHAGFRFEREVDVARLIDDGRGQYPKRPLRMRINREIMLHTLGGSAPAILRDISQQGACIECDQRLPLRQSVRIEAAGLEPIFAKVCWRQQPRHGLVFERAYLLAELAQHLVTLQDKPAVAAAVRAPVTRAV